MLRLFLVWPINGVDTNADWQPPATSVRWSSKTKPPTTLKNQTSAHTHVCRYVRTKSDDTSCLCMLSHFKSGRLFSQVQIFGYNLSVEFVQTRFCLLLPDHTVSVVLQESNPFFSVIVQCGCTHNILPTFKRPGCTEQPNNSMDFPNLKAAPSASGR